MQKSKFQLFFFFLFASLLLILKATSPKVLKNHIRIEQIQCLIFLYSFVSITDTDLGSRTPMVKGTKQCVRLVSKKALLIGAEPNFAALC